MLRTSESNPDPTCLDYGAHCGDLSRGTDERDVSRCARTSCAATWAHASLHRRHSCSTCGECGRTFHSRDGGAEKQDGPSLWCRSWVKPADCDARCSIASFCMLSLWDAVGSDLHTVRGSCGDDLGPD